MLMSFEQSRRKRSKVFLPILVFSLLRVRKHNNSKTHNFFMRPETLMETTVHDAFSSPF